MKTSLPLMRKKMQPARGLFQFSLRDAAIGMGVVGCGIWFHQATGGRLARLVMPETYCGLLAIGCIGLATLYAGKRGDVENACWLLVVGWLLALLETLDRLILATGVISPGPSAASLAVAQYHAIPAGLTLPMLCSVPAVYWILANIRQPVSRANRWFTVIAMFAIVDVLVVILNTVSCFGVIVRDGIITWRPY